MVDVAPEVREFLGEGPLREHLEELGPLPCADCRAQVAPDAGAALVIFVPAGQPLQADGVDEELVLALCHVACRSSDVFEVDRPVFEAMSGRDAGGVCTLVLACDSDVPTLVVGVPYSMRYQPAGQQEMASSALQAMLHDGFHLVGPSPQQVPRAPVPGWEVCLGAPPDHPGWAVWLRHDERTVVESGYVVAPERLEAALALHDYQILVWLVSARITVEDWPAQLDQARRQGAATAAWTRAVLGLAMRP